MLEREIDFSSIEKEPEYKPTFRTDHLAILVSRYGGFEIGVQDFNKKELNQLRLAEIENFPTTPKAGDNDAILENILESLPEKRIDFEKFKSTVQETLNVLFDGKAKVSFPNEQYINCAIECMEEDSWEPAIMEGEDVLRGVGIAFGLDKFQIQRLLKEELKNNSKE